MDVSQVNTYPELAAILAQLEAKLLMGGLDPDVTKDLNRQVEDIKNRMLDLQKRDETEIERLARRVKDVDSRADRSPKRNIAA